MDQLTRIRIDGLEQPGRGIRPHVDPCTGTQDESFVRRKVEIPLEAASTARDMDLDVTDLHVTQAEGTRIQVRIEFRDDPDFPNRCGGRRGRLELNRVW